MAPHDRRSFLRGLATLPLIGDSVALTRDPAGTVPTFDPQAFCKDLIDAGYQVLARMPVDLGHFDLKKRPSYFVLPPEGRGFGRSYNEVMAKWRDALDACPDHVEQVVRYASDQQRRVL